MDLVVVEVVTVVPTFLVVVVDHMEILAVLDVIIVVLTLVAVAVVQVLLVEVDYHQVDPTQPLVELVV